MSGTPFGGQPSEQATLMQRAGVAVDDESRCVTLVVEGTQFVFSAGAADVAESIAVLEQLAARARFAAGALEQCRRELAAQQAAVDELRAQPPCRLCARPTAGVHCYWCGTPTSGPPSA